MKQLLIPALLLIIYNCSSSNYIRTSHQNGFDSGMVDNYVLMGLETELGKSGLLSKKKMGDRPAEEIEEELADSLIKLFGYEQIALEQTTVLNHDNLNVALDDFHRNVKNAIDNKETYPNFKIDTEVLDKYKKPGIQYGLYLNLWHNYNTVYMNYVSVKETYTGLSAVIINFSNNEIVWRTSFSEFMEGSEEEIISLIKSFILDLKYQIEIPASELRFKPKEFLVQVSFKDESNKSVLGYINSLDGFHFNFTDRLDKKSKIHVKDVDKIKLIRTNRIIFSGQ